MYVSLQYKKMFKNWQKPYELINSNNSKTFCTFLIQDNQVLLRISIYTFTFRVYAVDDRNRTISVNFGISVVSFRFVSVRSRNTETELLSSFLPYFKTFFLILPILNENSSIYMKQNIGNKINQIQIDNKPDFFGQKIIQRGSILECYICLVSFR